ncbi:protein ELYS isoform X7 [Dicentrarchus labrax]|uniref:Protein ELYS n=1 Tax=Dicentrarchus labrax TaxID=13489 RepID=A0A8C4DKC8_DICLA|nr:protein ELYS isoform X4 [Dicentrarchus labrax]XP_051235127.1 protein ELYS isoform X5 [Dicentrarchus labrax]XP_051235128.1 protein ELYS isoform X6 [Dicentrarchus labrax]XP_051235129.1 protein ELYS isoform X7 [Dicentrarchus labrax]
MHDLTAQVTSSLLPFPGVTIDALGEDEITLDSVLHGKFTVGRSGLAWLACGPHLEVVHAVTGERLSAYCFSGGGEHPPSVLAARDFSWLKRSGLLVGLEEAEGSVLCLYDLGLSRVVKAVVIPGRITAIEPLVSYGGASTSTQHLHQSLRWFFGIAAVVTDLGHVLLVDLCLDDLSCSQSELEASDLQVVTKSPAEIPRLREVSTRQGRHLCLQLNGPSGVGATALQYISRTNQLAVGFSDGYLQLWNMKVLKKEYHSQLEGGRVPVHAFTFQEPENDPRNCCYLWAVQSSQDLEGDMVSLHLLQLAFSERKCLASGKILYEGLEYCEERYSQELNGTAFPLRAQATNIRLLSCQTIEKFRPHPDRDDSMNEVASPDTSVSIFSWQVKAYGQGTPSTFIGVFDINRWYHAQMPDSLRTGESLQNCPYLAVWSLDPVVQMVSSHPLLDVAVHDRSLSRGLPFTCPPPEQYFNPTTYNFDATCLLNSGIVHLTCSGYQKETLSFLKKAAPCSSDIISTSYSRCLMSGLLSSRLADTQASSLSQEEQLDAILSTAVETSSLGLITGCIKQWTAEEQPGSALNLRYILDWAWNKVVQTKEELDGICAPLFDSSSNFTDPQTMQLLQHSQRLLGNLSTIFHCLLSEAQELTQKGLVGLMNKNMVSSLISKYAQVVLWFCRTGLLPEGSDNDALQISRPFYTHSVISNYYTIRREELTRLAKGKWCADCLMIDGLVRQCGERLTNLWKRDDGGTGQYPPPTLHALLDIYLLDNIDEAAKHAIVIYLLLDVMYSFPNKEGASVESFPTAFAIPIGLVKLVQGLWLLDHHDHQSSFELLLHPAASQCQFEWQHERVLQALMCQGQHSVALRYFHVTKPPISSTSQAKLCLSVLLHNRCLIEAWSLVRQHSNRLNMGELLGFLYESCQELGLIKELLKLPLGLTEQECLEKFLQGTGGLQNRELLMVHYLQQANYIPALQLNHSLKMNLVNERDPKLKERSNTRNSILDQYGKVLPRVQRKLAMEKAKPYQHPYAIHREVSRPQPLSTITKRSTNEKVMSRAGFINNVLTKIEEVWLGKGASPQSTPVKSPRVADVQSPKPSLALPDPFLGTPITMTSKRKSRLMDFVVHPSCQTPRTLLSPPRPPSSWVSPKSTSKAPELSLLQTPQVVKRARALAASGPVFSAFTPQSILRSSLRPTPVATPSASPGRSITPPLRSKESRITFIEEAESPEPEKGIRWTNGMAAESEISLLARGSTLSKATRETWSLQPAEEEEEGDEEGEQSHVKFMPPEGGVPSPQLRCFESESSSIYKDAADSRPSDATHAQLSLSFDSSQTPVRSTDTTLEYYDAPLSEEQEEEHTDPEKKDEVVTMNIRGLTEKGEPEEKPSPIIEQTPLLTSEDLEREEEEAKDDEIFEDVMEIGLEQEDKTEEEVQSEQEDKTEEEVQSEQEDKTEEEVQSEQEDKTEEEVQSEQEDKTEEEVQSEQEDKTEEEVQSEQEDKTEEEVQSEKEEKQDAESSTKQEDAATLDQEETFSHNQVCDQVTERANSGIEVESQDQPVKATGQDIQSEATESTEFIECLKPSGATEPTYEPEEELEQSADLTEFVQRHLFGGDLSPPLTRSGIHNASQTQTFFNSESLGEVEEEEPAAVEPPPVFTSQKSIASVTSSEPTGTDSHSVVSLNDSEELSSPMSEEEEEDEEESDQAEEEEEDSGSEVEIIEEVQGNGRLPPLQPSSVFVQHTHFLSSLSEQEAPEFPLITPGAEMKMVEEDMEGEVVMVRLGADEGGMEADEVEEQGSSYMELKPSTTLLVPLELMEGQAGLMASSQLGLPELPQAVVPDDPRSETHSGFSLMLDMEEDGDKDADTQPMENDLQFSDPPTLSPAVEASDELVTKPEVILLGTDDQDPLLSEGASEEDQQKELDILDGAEVDGLTETELVNLDDQAVLQTENTDENHETEDAKEQMDTELVMLAEDQEPVGVSVCEPTPVEELPAVVDDKDSVAEKDAAEEKMMEKEEIEEEGEKEEIEEEGEKEEEEEVKPTPAEDQEEPEKNGLVNMDTEIAPSVETATVVEEKQPDPIIPAETEEDNGEEIKTEKETKKRGRPRKHKEVEEEKPVSNSQPEEQPVPETPTSQRKKKAPSTPTRRTTRARAVTFISPLQEEAEEDGKVEEAETSTLAPASPSRTPRKGKQNKEIKVRASTPRRTTRKTQPVEEEEAMDNDTTVASTSKASSPGRRRASQKAPSTKASQSGSEEVSAATEGEDEATDTKASERTSSKTPTPAKRRTAQASTPRRSSRRILSSSEVVPLPLEILKEEKEQEEVFASPAKRNSRKSKTESSETQPALMEEEESKKRVSSPSRSTRQSNRITLNVYPQVKLVPVSLPQSVRKKRAELITENINESEALLEPELNSNTGRTNSLRPTRSKLWDHPEEDLPLLDSPLEVDSETPVADALIKRLQDEEEKQEGGVVVRKMVRTSKRATKSSVEQDHSLQDSLFPEPEEDESSPGEHSFIYSPSRRRTRANRAESPGPSEESAAPVTRSRRRVVKDTSVAPPDEIASEDDPLEVEKAVGVSKTRKTGKRTTKSKAVPEPPPVAEVDLLSPLPSPADPLPRALKRIKEGEAPTSSMNLRRKRIMDTVFTKPVTRRKKL